MGVKIKNIFWWMVGMLIPVLILVSSSAEATWRVNYEENTYNDSLVTWATDHMFVISQTDRVPLSPFKETAQVTVVPREVKKPLISIMVSKVDDTVKEKPPQVEQKQKEQPVVQKDRIYTVYFNFDSYRLRRDQIPVLNNIQLKGGDVADVYGYTCRIGPDSYNRRLSQKRAKTVADYLRKRGVAVGKVVGMGKTNEERILRLNRKAVIQLH